MIFLRFIWSIEPETFARAGCHAYLSLIQGCYILDWWVHFWGRQCLVGINSCDHWFAWTLFELLPFGWDLQGRSYLILVVSSWVQSAGRFLARPLKIARIFWLAQARLGTVSRWRHLTMDTFGPSLSSSHLFMSVNLVSHPYWIIWSEKHVYKYVLIFIL